MTRGPRKQPALVVLALLGAAALVVWLARTDEDGHAPARPGPRGVHTGRTTPVVELAPPSSSISAPPTVDAPAPAAPGREGREEAGGLADEPRDLRGEDSLRGVRGLVRDARTSLPIAGAWLTWKAPGATFGALVDELLGGFGPEDVASGLVTGSDGRFAVDRLLASDDISSTLHAVAAGYAAKALRPGLREEVVFELEPMGSLEVRIAEESPVDWSRAGRATAGLRRYVRVEPVPDDPARSSAFAAVNEHLGVARVSHLAAGSWRVRLEGGEHRVVDVTAGRTTVVEIAATPREKIDGTVIGATYGSIVLVHLDDDAESRVALPLTDGQFRGELRAGRYRALLALDGDGDGDEETERSLPDVVEVRPGESRLLLRAPPAGEEVQVTLTHAGQPRLSGRVGLVALDDSLQGTLVGLHRDEEVHRGQAPAGRYALFDDTCLLADLTLPAAGVFVVATDPVEVRLRFVLPAALRPDETLRGEVSLVPRILSGELAQRFARSEQVKLRLTRAAPVLTLQIVAAGRYLLVGETDLGPLEAWVDLAPGAEVTVSLGE